MSGILPTRRDSSDLLPVGGHEKDTKSGISGSSGIGESTTIITGMKLFD
jgi:hypothetical protein